MKNHLFSPSLPAMPAAGGRLARQSEAASAQAGDESPARCAVWRGRLNFEQNPRGFAL